MKSSFGTLYKACVSIEDDNRGAEKMLNNKVADVTLMISTLFIGIINLIMGSNYRRSSYEAKFL